MESINGWFARDPNKGTSCWDPIETNDLSALSNLPNLGDLFIAGGEANDLSQFYDHPSLKNIRFYNVDISQDEVDKLNADQFAHKVWLRPEKSNPTSTV